MQYQLLCRALTCVLSYQCVSSLRFGLYEAEVALFQDCSELVNVSFTPSMLDIVPEKTEHVVTMTACLNVTNLNVSNLPSSLDVALKEDDLLTLKIISDSRLNLARWERGADACYLGNFTVRAVRLGRSGVTVDVSLDDVTKCSYKYDVTVVREARVVDVVFNIGLVVMLAVNNIGFGCKFELDVAKKVFKAPVSLLIGFFCQYGMMPLIAFGLGRAVSLSPPLAFGLLTSGSCPGGGQSNVWTVMVDGDITLSICMTITSCFASLGMMPLWLLNLGRFVLHDNDIRIPFSRIVLSLLVLIVPLSIGLVIRKLLPRVGEFIRERMKFIAVFVIVYLLTVGVYSNWYALQFMLTDWKLFLCALLLPWTGCLVSGLVALVFRQPWTRVKTIGIETSYQNSGIALLVLRTSLPQPEADVTSIIPILLVITTPLPFLIGVVVRFIVQRCKKCLNSTRDEEEKTDSIKDSTVEEPQDADIKCKENGHGTMSNDVVNVGVIEEIDLGTI